MSNFATFKISQLYKFVKGNNAFNKGTINENKGEYPVYSGQSTDSGIIGYANSYKYNGEFIRIITVGEAGKTNVINGKFSLAQNNGILFPLECEASQHIDKTYLSFLLSKVLPSLAKGEGKQKSLLKQTIDNLVIELPINKDGLPDINKQKILAQKYYKIHNQQINLLNNKKYLSEIRIDLKDDSCKKYLKISEIFDLSIRTNNSSFTKAFIKENPGEIPVYGASKNPEEIGYGFVQDNLPSVKYFENCLTYNIDASAGYVFYRTGRFSLSEKVRPLIIKPKYQGMLYEPYLEYVIQPIFRANIQGRRGPNGENEFTKINKTIIQDLQIPIPIKENGEFDLKAQKEIAEKYKKLESIKKQVINEIDKVLKINIEF